MRSTLAGDLVAAAPRAITSREAIVFDQLCVDLIGGLVLRIGKPVRLPSGQLRVGGRTARGHE
jgi:hypothetical protein